MNNTTKTAMIIVVKSELSPALPFSVSYYADDLGVQQFQTYIANLHQLASMIVALRVEKILLTGHHDYHDQLEIPYITEDETLELTNNIHMITRANGVYKYRPTVNLRVDYNGK